MCRVGSQLYYNLEVTEKSFFALIQLIYETLSLSLSPVYMSISD